jgi:hypothetical protein
MAWSAEQRRNANIIASVGRRLGASQRDIQIALMAAIVESGLRNLHYGDRDSVGLFQQRNAWGTFQQRTDPASAARMFFTGGHAGQRGLFDIRDRHRMSPGQAAQAVQVSAFPDRYDQHRAEAARLLGMADFDAPVGGGGSRNLAFTRTTLGDVPGLDEWTRSLEARQVKPDFNTVNDLGELTSEGGPLGPVTFDASGPLASAQSDEADDALGGVDFDSAEPFKFGGPEDPMSDLHMPGADEFADLFPGGGAGGGAGGGFDLGDLGGDMGGGVGVPVGTGWRAKVVQAARKMLGTPYVWGGTSYSGVDCSGLIKLIYGKYGIDMPRISADQARSGQRVPISQLEPGDLVAWDNSSRNNGADHIAIYAGDGKIIEAARPGTNVQVSSIYGNAWGVKLGMPGGGDVSFSTPFEQAGSGVKQVGPGTGRWGTHYRVSSAGSEIQDKFGISNIGGFSDRNIGGTNKKSDHAFGLALDFMGAKQDVADYLVQNAQRMGVDYVIYNRRIWSAERADEGWRPYSGASPHTDHVHASFLAEGADWMPPSESNPSMRGARPSRSTGRLMPPTLSMGAQPLMPPPRSRRAETGYRPATGRATPDYTPSRRTRTSSNSPRRRTGTSSSSHYVAPTSFKRPTRSSSPPPPRRPKKRQGGASGGGSSSGKRPV